MESNDTIPNRKVIVRDTIPGIECLEISNSKHQIPMKSQFSISNHPNRFDILNFGHCDLPFDLAQGGELVEPFVICYLRFGIFHRNLKVSSSIKLDAAARGSAEP
jgi:hypothetical protein